MRKRAYRITMRGGETIERSLTRACQIALSMLLALNACNARHPPKKPPARAASSASLATELKAPAPASEQLLPRPIAEALEEVHEQRAEIAPLRDQITRLAFGKERLAQALENKVVFRDLKDGSVATESELGTVYAVSESPNGSVFALGLSGGAWLEPQHKKARPFPHVAFFRGAALYPDLEQPSDFYVYYELQHELFHYAVESEGGAFLPIEDRYPLTDCESAPSLTRDGAFLCTTSDGVERRAPRGREARYRWPKAATPAVHLLGAKRFDEIYAVAQSGEVVRFRLEPGMPEQARFQLPGLPFVAVANGEVLAFVLVIPPSARAPRRFTLLVTDFDGQERFKVELPSRGAEASDDWLKAVIGDKNLALSRFESLVAVGGPNSVSVWDYALGSLVFSR